jgi:hypothetical protein
MHSEVLVFHGNGTECGTSRKDQTRSGRIRWIHRVRLVFENSKCAVPAKHHDPRIGNQEFNSPERGMQVQKYLRLFGPRVPQVDFRASESDMNLAALKFLGANPPLHAAERGV